MVGGTEEGYSEVRDILTKIAAQADGPCCGFVGARSAGHYVKMIHNGIEYAIMETIAEAYDLMRKSLGMDPPEMSEVFRIWNEGELSSYLIGITADILDRTDEETGKPLIDLILDVARQKGTGKWSSEEALELGAPAPMITEAVNARLYTEFKRERETASDLLPRTSPAYQGNREDFLSKLEKACYLAMLAAYSEGMRILRKASSRYGYGLDLIEVSRIWKGGCIIRSKMLYPIQRAFEKNPSLENLLVSEEFLPQIGSHIDALREVVKTGSELGVPIPGFMGALFDFDAYRSEKLPANLIQAQRDYFGAHTYERTDREGKFHTEWSG